MILTWYWLSWLPLQGLICHQSDGLVQNCGNSSALAMGLLQSCTKPSEYHTSKYGEYSLMLQIIYIQ